MKKILTFIAVSFLMFSCTENDNLNELNNTEAIIISQSKINQVFETENLIEQKLSYSLLNSHEKLSLWNYKLDKIINSKSLNSKQLKLISELESKFINEIFVEDSDKQVYFKTIYIPSFLEKLKEEFNIKTNRKVFLFCIYS